MSYYNQPLTGLGKAKATKNMQAEGKTASQYKNGAANTKMVQAIFLPGAWGKIPDFMGKNHPTPGAAMAFLHAQNYPLKPDFFRREKIF